MNDKTKKEEKILKQNRTASRKSVARAWEYVNVGRCQTKPRLLSASLQGIPFIFFSLHSLVRVSLLVFSSLCVSFYLLRTTIDFGAYFLFLKNAFDALSLSVFVLSTDADTTVAAVAAVRLIIETRSHPFHFLCISQLAHSFWSNVYVAGAGARECVCACGPCVHPRAISL